MACFNPGRFEAKVVGFLKGAPQAHIWVVTRSTRCRSSSAASGDHSHNLDAAGFSSAIITLWARHSFRSESVTRAKASPLTTVSALGAPEVRARDHDEQGVPKWTNHTRFERIHCRMTPNTFGHNRSR